MATSTWGCYEEDSSITDRLVKYAERLNENGLSKKEKQLLKALIQECLRQMKPKKKKRKKRK